MPPSPRLVIAPAAPAGGSRELLGLAWPLILSNGVITALLTIDRIMLSWHGRDDVATANLRNCQKCRIPPRLFKIVSCRAGRIRRCFRRMTGAVPYTSPHRPRGVGP